LDALKYTPFYERNLPHFQPPGATFFITFRLANSLPASIQQALLYEIHGVVKALEKAADPQERARQLDVFQRLSFKKWDSSLDLAQHGPTWLYTPQIAGLMAESLHYWDGRRYDLIAFCIMPNHVHLVCTPMETTEGTYYSLSRIMHSLKSYTGHMGNKILGRKGDFWQHESFDRVVRDEAELERIIAYVLTNPVKAGLVHSENEWRWSYYKYEE